MLFSNFHLISPEVRKSNSRKVTFENGLIGNTRKDKMLAKLNETKYLLV